VTPEIIKHYQKDIDKTLLIENLKLTPQQRSEKFVKFMELCFELRSNAAANRAASRKVTAQNNQ
jgi:hypothetical protein